MQIQSEQNNELSCQYFQKCPQLALIEEPFDLKNSQQQKERRDLDTQFQLLRALTQTKKHKNKLRINSIIENKKNRYPEQSIYQHSRVLLPQSNGQDLAYINANFVPLCLSKKIIISQAPLESTQAEFQQMLQQEEIQCVIMLCNIIENGKIRAFDYLMNRNTETLKEVEDYLTVSRVKIPTQKEDQSWNYIHIHYSQWPDRGLPQDLEHIKKVLQQAQQFKKILIHCSAGLGRSGVLASALLLELKARSGQKVSVFQTVRRMRQYRFGVVQNSEQYKFIYSYLCNLSKQLE